MPLQNLPSGIKFDEHRVCARKDLLHFVEEELCSEVLQNLGKNPDRWIEELDIISSALTGEGLVAGIDLHLPPQEDNAFQKLGENVFLYRGKNNQLRGLWLSKLSERLDWSTKKLVPYTQWTHYRLGTTATLNINKDFSDIPPENLLPENFEQKADVVKSDKRPILKFDTEHQGKQTTIFAKGAYYSISKLCSPPSYRLTNMSGMNKITSEMEMQKIIELASHGVKVPAIVGYYESLVEEFLFLRKVEGKNPAAYMKSHRDTIIKQDAHMLATLCLLGHNKVGFTDLEDKIFDGTHLYLIDTEEFNDLYFPMKFDFRGMVINPLCTKEMDEFKRLQKSRFKLALRDAIFEYRENLTPTLEDQIKYIGTFYKTVGWGKPTEGQIKKLTEFPKDYRTWESYVSGMMDNS